VYVLEPFYPEKTERYILSFWDRDMLEKQKLSMIYISRLKQL